MPTNNMTNQNFDDDLHQLVNTPRPELEYQAAAIGVTIQRLAETCVDQDDQWKRLILAIFHKRYHIRAPEAKAVKSALAEDDKETHKTETATGDGERKIFYLAVKALF